MDTHILIWWLEDNPKCPIKIRSAIQKNENEIFISSATIWEIQVKKGKGKLSAPDNLLEELKKNQFLNLPITSLHVMELNSLPAIHMDPFDRILVAQARFEEMKLATMDEKIKKYPVQFI